MLHQRADTAVALAGVEASRAFFAPCFAGERDSLWVAHVDARARCIHLASYPSDPQRAQVPCHDIARDAVLLGSAGVMLAHHDSDRGGMPTDRDAHATRELSRAVEPMQVCVLDHLIFSGTECSSMRRLGLL